MASTQCPDYAFAVAECGVFGRKPNDFIPDPEVQKLRFEDVPWIKKSEWWRHSHSPF
jgi:hypothetical protein